MYRSMMKCALSVIVLSLVLVVVGVSAEETIADSQNTDAEAMPDQNKPDQAKTDQAKTDQAKTDQAKTDQDNTDPKKEALKKLGQWWRKNPRKYDPTSRFLIHAELEFNFLYDSGNLDRNVKLLEGVFVVRKGMLSNYLSWDYQDRHAERYGDELRDVKAYEVHNSIRYSLTTFLVARAGIINASNDELGYDWRLISYGGLGVRPIEKEYAILSIFAGGGYEEQDYSDEVKDIAQRTRHLGIYRKFESGGYHSPISYVHEKLYIFLSDKTGFEQSFEIIHYLDDDDTYRFSLSFGMQVAITEYITLVATYGIEYNSNPLPWVNTDALRLTEKKDQATTVNIRLSI